MNAHVDSSKITIAKLWCSLYAHQHRSGQRKCGVYTTEYYLVIRKDKFQSSVRKLMHLETIMLSEIDQTQMVKYHIASLILETQNIINFCVKLTVQTFQYNTCGKKQQLTHNICHN